MIKVQETTTLVLWDICTLCENGYDWYNKKLNDQKLGRRYRGISRQREDSRKKNYQPDSEEAAWAVQRDEKTSLVKDCSLK